MAEEAYNAIVNDISDLTADPGSDLYTLARFDESDESQTIILLNAPVAAGIAEEVEGVEVIDSHTLAIPR